MEWRESETARKREWEREGLSEREKQQPILIRIYVMLSTPTTSHFERGEIKHVLWSVQNTTQCVERSAHACECLSRCCSTMRVFHTTTTHSCSCCYCRHSRRNAARSCACAYVSEPDLIMSTFRRSCCSCTLVVCSLYGTAPATCFCNFYLHALALQRCRSKSLCPFCQIFFLPNKL